MKHWAAVVRVSHMGERKAGTARFHADREQLDPIEQWATARGVSLEVMRPELGVSGGLPLEKRPSLLRAIEGVERGEYAGVVVAYLSRLGRNVAEQLRAWERVENAGGQIVTIREGIDTSTASGRLHRNLLLSVDAHEREQHAEHFEERRRLATEAGIWQRRQTPRGYRRDPDSRHLVPDKEADSVRTAFRDCLRGTPLSALANRMRMSPSGVRYLLRNRVYLGELRVGKHVNRDAHPPLIDAQTFEAVQQNLSERVRPGRGRSRAPALLAGLSRCASCGHVMTRANSNGGAAYTCPRQHSGGRCPSPTGIMAGRLDPYVEQIALRELGRLEVTATKEDQTARAQAALDEAERELDSFLDAVSAQDVGADAFNRAARKKRAAIEEARDAFRAELAKRPILPMVQSGADVWGDLSAYERNSLLRHLLKAVIVRPVGRGRRVPIADRVRVLQYGTELNLPRQGITPIPFPDADGVGVLRTATVENGPQGERRTR